jgi:two-component system, NarL family, response regulator DevR
VGQIRVFLLDDHSVVREGLHSLLAQDPEIDVVGEAGMATEATDKLVRLLPDVAILDVRLPDGSGIDVARYLGSFAPSVSCVMFTAVSEEDAFLKSVLAGAVGYLPKDAVAEQVVDTVRRAAAGESLIDPEMLDRLRNRELPDEIFQGVLEQLTPYERRILHLVAEGHTNREIAAQLNLAEKTVRNYVSSILGKIGARNRTQLAVYVARIMATRTS